jgi:hypothetical protein
MKTFTGQQEVDISECNSITAKKIYLWKAATYMSAYIASKFEACFLSLCII